MNNDNTESPVSQFCVAAEVPYSGTQSYIVRLTPLFDTIEEARSALEYVEVSVLNARIREECFV